MSFITPPLISFIGKCYANASTATNNDVADVLDIDTLKFRETMTPIKGGTVVQPEGQQNFSYTNSKDNPKLREWLMGYMKTPPSVHEGGFAQMAHWNYYGDHNTEFQETKVNNIIIPDGTPVPKDSLIGANVELLGNVFYERRRGAALVDVDPYALVTSQMFSGQLKISFPTAGSSAALMEANNPVTGYSYFINPHKNLNEKCIGFQAVSAIFMCAVPKENIVFSDTFSSPAFDLFKAQVAAAKGIQCRYCFYDAVFEIPADQLAEKFANGEYVANPYLGRLLGTIGVWHEGELAVAPPARSLNVQTPYNYIPPTRNDVTFEDHVEPFATVQTYKAPEIRNARRETGADGNAKPKQATLGATLASVDKSTRTVWVDTVSTFPEATPGSREKYPLGKTSLVLTDNAGAIKALLGEIPNTKAIYEATSGIVPVNWSHGSDPAFIDANIDTLRLGIAREDRTSGTLTPLIQEAVGIDIQTDDRAVYFDAAYKGESGPVPGTAEVTINVFKRGQLVQQDTPVNLEYWMCAKDFVDPDKPQVPVVDRYYTVEGAKPLGTTTYTGVPANPPKIEVITDQVTVPAGGKLTLKLTALRPGVSMLRFTDPANQVSPNFGWDNVYYAVIRILPFDDYSSYSDEQINDWGFMYEHFFGFFSAMYPIMSTVVPWGPDDAPNDPDQVKTMATNLKNFTSKDMWESSIYMPITRDLSDGKRDLLHRWCNLQE